jgi:hypothetical protein
MALAACSVFGDFGSFSTEDPSAATDAATEAQQTSGDSSTGDASAGEDGAGGEAGAPFCMPGAHAFCADFEGADALAIFTSPYVDPTGKLEVSTTQAKSGTQSLFTFLPRRETQKTNVVIFKEIDTAWRRTIVELDMYLDPAAWQQGDVNAALLEVGFVSDAGGTAFFVIAGPSYASLAGGGTPDTLGSPLAYSKWMHVRADVTTTQFQVNIDGSVRTHAVNVPAGSTNPRFEVAVGITGFNAPVPALGVYYDNLTVDFP